MTCGARKDLLPTYNILDGAKALLESHRIGKRLLGEAGVRAVLPCENSIET